MGNIDELLALILSASRGDEVRDNIVASIQQCYTDGKAGSVDLAARKSIEDVRNVNDRQDVDIDVLRAEIDDLKGGGGSGGDESTGTVTTDIPSFIFDAGIVNSISVVERRVATQHVTFSKTFTEPPSCFCMIMVQTTATYPYGSLQVVAVKSSISETGFDFSVCNNSGTDRSVTVGWIAIQPTTITVETDITVPATDDLTQEQIDNLIGLLD